VPSFKIYGGVAGLYDYGPPGCVVRLTASLSGARYCTTTSQKDTELLYLDVSVSLLGMFEAKASHFLVLIDFGLTRKRAAAVVLGAGSGF